MAISKIILNGVTQMDVTGKTVTSASMRSGVTALKNDGTDITGSLADMTLPSSASASSSGTSKATITPTSSAQYLNIPTGYNDTAQYYTIAAASGGASNFVTGTFKGTTTGTAMDVTIPYTGNGYPIVVVIEPTGGFRGNTTFSSAIQRYAAAIYPANKGNASIAPVYGSSSTDDSACVMLLYKGSTTNATSYSNNTGSNVAFYKDTAAASSANNIVKMKTDKKMSVYIASNSYGFMANVEYTYHVLYSS